MTSFSIHGVGVSSGIAIGQAHLLSNALLEVVHYQLPKHLIDDEIKRFSNAIATVRQDLEQIKGSLRKNAPAELAAFVSTHLMMLEDKSLSEIPKDIIRNEQCNAEWAIKLQMDDIVDQFEQIEDTYLRERKQDVVQVVERVIKVLNASIAAASSAPLASNVTIAPLAAASIMTPMMLLAFTRRPLRSIHISLANLLAVCVSLVEARACRPNLLMISNCLLII